MTRPELLDRLSAILTKLPASSPAFEDVRSLAVDIETDGVLDVQCPEEIAIDMDLPRPSTGGKS